jgi:hypothetical protein
MRLNSAVKEDENGEASKKSIRLGLQRPLYKQAGAGLVEPYLSIVTIIS